jgi:hypothetical protein
MAAFGGRRLYAESGPLGIARITPRAVVTYAEVGKLIEPLGLDEPARVQLQSAVRKIMSDYLGPRISRARHNTYASSLRKLTSVANGAGRLAGWIEMLEPDVLVQLDRLRADTPDLLQKSRPFFDFLHLTRQLRDLAAVATYGKQAIGANAVGRPERALLKDAVEALVVATEAAVNEPVIVIKSKPPRFEGRGGLFIRSLFEHFDPAIKAAAVATIVADRASEVAGSDGEERCVPDQ